MAETKPKEKEPINAEDAMRALVEDREAREAQASKMFDAFQIEIKHKTNCALVIYPGIEDGRIVTRAQMRSL